MTTMLTVSLWRVLDWMNHPVKTSNAMKNDGQWTSDSR